MPTTVRTAATQAAAPRKLAAKSVTKPVVKKPVATPKARPAPRAAKKPTAAPVTKAPAAAGAKPAKRKLVRDGFTIPADEYAVLGELKQRALAAAHPVKKSELLRAGIKLLAALSDKALLAALKDVPAIKTGRPGKK